VCPAAGSTLKEGEIDGQKGGDRWATLEIGITKSFNLSNFNSKKKPQHLTRKHELHFNSVVINLLIMYLWNEVYLFLSIQNW
jgi:hypothetical protein